MKKFFFTCSVFLTLLVCLQGCQAGCSIKQHNPNDNVHLYIGNLSDNNSVKDVVTGAIKVLKEEKSVQTIVFYNQDDYFTAFEHVDSQFVMVEDHSIYADVEDTDVPLEGTKTVFGFKPKRSKLVFILCLNDSYCEELLHAQ